MAQVAITINGRSYDIACDDGQEEHLSRLGLYLDQKVAELVGNVGQVGDARLMVMAGLLIADELADAYDELAEAKEANQDGAPRTGGESPERAGAVQQSIERLTRRIEDVAARLEGA